MRRYSLLLMYLFSWNAYPQITESPLKTFGYFQNQFEYNNYENEYDVTSFSMQQLNIFMQKDIAPDWSALVNLELVNNYSSIKQWGSFNLEEAWVRYRYGRVFNIKLGLQIPIFNNLNEIKNKSPLLPYIIRPLIYETSFKEILDLDEYLPARAHFQVFGFIPWNKSKIDYAVYLGNSPNINADKYKGLTGTDTSSTILIGGRIGIRNGEFKTGISYSHDKMNLTVDEHVLQAFQVPISRFNRIPRTRLGVDISYRYKSVFGESEYIKVNYDDDIEELKIAKSFYYMTLGYYLTERLLTYTSYWVTDENFTTIDMPDEQSFIIKNGDIDIRVYNLGLSYNLNDRITLKAQAAKGKIKSDCSELIPTTKFFFYSVAISVFF